MNEKNTKKMVSFHVLQEMFGPHGTSTILFDADALGSFYYVSKDTVIMAFDTYILDKKVTFTLKLDASKKALGIVGIGDVHHRHTFKEGAWGVSSYFYGGGVMTLRNYVKVLDYALVAEGGLIEVTYELWSGDTHMGYYHYDICIT